MANNNIKLTISADDKASRVIEDAAQKIKRSTSSVSNEAKDAADKFTSHFSFIGTAVKAVAATAVAGGAALLGFGLTSATQLQNTAASFKALTGDATVAKSLFKDLYDFARGTPFAFPDVADAARTLMGYGRTATDVKDDIKTLGGMVATTGADWQRLSVVYGQVNAAGKLYAQDALQLIQNGVPITSALADKLGVSIQDVKKKMEDGEISAQLFNEAMRDMVPANAIEEMSNTMTGKLSGLTGSVRNLAFSLLGIDYSKIEDGGPVLVEQGGLFDRITVMVEGLSKKLSDPQIKMAFQKIGHAMANVVEGGGRTLLHFIQFVAENMTLLKVAAISLGAAFVTMKVGNAVADFLSLARALPTVGAAFALLGLNPVVLAISGLIGGVVALSFALDSMRSSTDRTKLAIDGHKSAQDALAQANRDAKQAQDDLNSAVTSAQGAALAVERAQRSYNETVAQYGPNSLEAREAAHRLREAEERLAQANLDVKNKTQEKQAAESEAAKKRQELEKAEAAKKVALDQTRDAANQAAGGFRNVGLSIDELNRKEVKPKAGFDAGSAPLTLNKVLGKNASGTSYWRGGSTIVGENGPEIVRLPQGAQVTPAYRTRNELNQGGGGGVTVHITGPVTFNNGTDMDQFADRINRTQRLALKGAA